MEDKLIKRNKDYLDKLNLPVIKPKIKVMVLDVYCPYSLDIINFKEMKIYTNADRGMHGCMAGQIIKMVNSEAELYGSRYGNLDEVINYCIKEEIRIISASITSSYSEFDEKALKKYYDWGGIFVAAAGNDNDRSVAYPGSSKYTICVSATNSEDCNGAEITITSDSNWYVRNKEKGMYHGFDGTSAATPVITGCITYILAKYTHYRLDDIVKYLKDNSTPLEEKYERFFSFPKDFNLEPKESFETEIKLKIDSKFYEVNGVKKEMDTAPFIKDSRTFIPIYFIATELGLEVEWNEKTREVTLKR